MTPDQWRAWLPSPQATRVIHQLWPETDEERLVLEQREQNDAIYTEAIARWFRETEPLR